MRSASPSCPGAHNTLFPAVIEALPSARRAGTSWCSAVGGIIPDDDIARVHDAGVKCVFTPGTTLKTIVEWVRANVSPDVA